MAARVPESRSGPRPPRRVAVMLGAGGRNVALLEALLPLLGSDRDVEVQGIFIEEADVRYAAELPFVKELCRVTFDVREFTSDQFDKALALRMRTAQRALDVIARRTGARHSFRNVRGSALGLLRETVLSADITVFEPGRLVGTGLPAIPARPRIVAVVTGDASARDVLEAALSLARGRVRQLTVVACPLQGGSPEEIEQAEHDVLRGRSGQARLECAGRVESLAGLLHGTAAGMLVLPAVPELMDHAFLRRLRDSVRCPICLVRRWEGGD